VLKNVKWRKETAKEWTTARPYVVSGVAMIADGPKLLGFKLTDGTEVWSQEFPGVVRGIGNDRALLYVGTLKGLLDAYPLPLTTKPENVMPH